MKSATIPITPEEKKELEELSKRKYNGKVWNYFKFVKRLRRPYTYKDFNKEYFVAPDWNKE